MHGLFVRSTASLSRYCSSVISPRANAVRTVPIPLARPMNRLRAKNTTARKVGQNSSGKIQKNGQGCHASPQWSAKTLTAPA